MLWVGVGKGEKNLNVHALAGIKLETLVDDTLEKNVFETASRRALEMKKMIHKYHS